MKNLAASGEIANYRKRASHGVNSQQSRQESRQRSRQGSRDSARGEKPSSRRSGRGEDAAVRASRDSTLSGESEAASGDGVSRTKSNRLTEKEKAWLAKEQERQQVVAAKLTDERTQERQQRIIAILEARDEKKYTPAFVDKYFKSFSGTGFLARNPPEPPTEEVMTRMR